MPSLNQRRQPIAPLAFIGGRIARGELAEVGDNVFFQRQTVLADGVPYEGLEDLLGASAPDAEDGLKCSAVDPGGGNGPHLGFGFVEPVVPGGFVRHGILSGTYIKDS